MNNERQHQILQLLEYKGEIQLNHLKEIFPEVSMMTLRRDLISLEADGYLIRTHGGAVNKKKLTGNNGEEDSYTRRASENIDSKMKIVEKVVSMVENGRSIYLDAGSTLMCLARILPDENFSIITSGTNIAIEILKKMRASVVTLGGTVNRNTLSVSGPNAIAFLDTVNIDIAFMSASGFSLDSGFSVSNIYECELKRKVVKRAKKVIVLMDTSKINKTLPFTYATLEDIDIWACETTVPEDIAAEAVKFGVVIR